jgi:hypothetical protein
MKYGNIISSQVATVKEQSTWSTKMLDNFASVGLHFNEIYGNIISSQVALLLVKEQATWSERVSGLSSWTGWTGSEFGGPGVKLVD